MENLEQKQNHQSGKVKEKKSRRIQIVVTESEYERLLEYGKDFKTVSDFIRNSCLEQNKKRFEKTKEMTNLLIQLTNEMNAIDKSINQVARYINFLLENKVVSDNINRFNSEIIKYTALQMSFEKLLKKIFN